MAVWRQPKGLRNSAPWGGWGMLWVGSGTPQQREPGRKSAVAGEGRRHCRGGREEEGRAAGGISLHQSTRLPLGSQRVGRLWRRPQAARSLLFIWGNWALLVQATGAQAPLVWAKGIRGLSARWCLLQDLQVAGTDLGSPLGGRREVWLATTGGL